MQYKRYLFLFLMIFSLNACADLPNARLAYQNGQYDAVKKDLEDLSQREFPEAQTKLAEMYRQGLGVPPDFKRAHVLFQHAAFLENYPSAWTGLGDLYRNGQGVTMDLKKAQDSYTHAAALGETTAHIRLGSLAQDQGQFDDAERFFQHALQKGNRSALLALGNLRLAQNKLEEAETFFQQAVADNIPDALFKLGQTYMKMKKYRLAISVFESSPLHDNINTFILLGDAYQAINIPAKAEESYLKAYHAGLHQASLKLSALYREEGKNRKPDLIAALTWLYIARQDGISDIERRIDHLERKLQPEELAEALKRFARRNS